MKWAIEFDRVYPDDMGDKRNMERITSVQTIKHADGNSHEQMYCFGHLWGPAFFKSETKDYEEYLSIVKRLAYYEDLEEQGKLLKLPCAVGDKLFVINKNRNNLITEENVYDVQYRGEKYAKGQRFFMNIGALAYFEMDFGKTVFLTREEAEAALRELEGKEE